MEILNSEKERDGSEEKQRILYYIERTYRGSREIVIQIEEKRLER